MDPEIFFLSVPLLGWELALGRLIATFILSLSAGLITHFVMLRGWLGQDIIRARQPASTRNTWSLVKDGWQRIRSSLAVSSRLAFAAGQPVPVTEAGCCGPAGISLTGSQQPAVSAAGGDCGSTDGSSCAIPRPAPFWRRLLSETAEASLMVARFMALAFLLEALIILYVPQEWIAGLVGRQNQGAIVLAALIGVPLYTTELAALPMIGGLLAQGMSPAAALAFLIAGPTTTLPAMAAVWGLVSRRVFALYVSFSLLGAIGLGYLYSFML